MSNANPSSLDAQLLTDLHRFFAAQTTAKHIPTEQLLDYLAGIDNAPWATFAQGKVITARHLARLLQPYGIVSKSIRVSATSTPKGYKAEDFKAAFAQLSDLPPHAENVTVNVAANVADRKLMDNNDVAANVADVAANVADNVAAPVPTQPTRKWPPPKGWVWNQQTERYEPPKPTVQPEPIDQALIGQTLHVSPHLKYLPGYGLVAIHEAEPCLS